MSRCKTGHRIRIRYERRRWKFWQWYVIVFCACCDLEIKDPFHAP